MKSNPEARRNCYIAFPRILAAVIHRLIHHMSADVVNSLLDALLRGLDDYSVDERGDVGSWIRIACVHGLTRVSELLLTNATSIPTFDYYFPPSKYHRAISGILKQGVERLDNVRQEAGECFMRLLNLPLPVVHGSHYWQIPGLPLLNDLFRGEAEEISWSDGGWLFPKAVRLLEIPEFRKSVLSGLVLSLASKTDSTQRPVATSLVSYVRSLPVSTNGGSYDITILVEDLIENIEKSITSNAVVVPVLQTFNALLEADALNGLSGDSRGINNLQHLLLILTRNITRFKSIPRILESMKIVVHFLVFSPLFDICVPRLVEFLTHRYPSVRRDTAEYLYVVLQGADVGRETDDVEQILLETEWSSSDISIANEAADRIVELFSSRDS